MLPKNRRAWLVGLGMWAACSEFEAADVEDSAGLSDTAADDDRTACAEPTDLVGRPRTIDEAVAFIDALPRPLTLECVLERLERPISLRATNSFVSLQPALSPQSPRVFLFEGDLIMSVAIEGEPGRHLLEFGELVGGGKSIKGEVDFPVHDVLGSAAPLERVRDPREPGTRCRICHGNEDAVVGRPGAFASDALRFREEDRVPLSALVEAWNDCDPTIEPARCARLDALLGPGPILEGDFPEDLPTIYDY